MAITLNLTIVVQIVNFLAAYWFIAKFLLKPGYKVLQSEFRKIADLKENVIIESQRLEMRQEYKRKIWKSCQQYFRENRPQLEYLPKKLIQGLTISELTPLNYQEKMKITDQIIQTLKQKVISQ